MAVLRPGSRVPSGTSSYLLPFIPSAMQRLWQDFPRSEQCTVMHCNPLQHLVSGLQLALMSLLFIIHSNFSLPSETSLFGLGSHET